MKKLIFSFLAAGLLAGCSSTPRVESDAETYLPSLSTYVSGVWEVKNELADLPWFFCSSSADESEQAFNPEGFHPVKGVAPSALKLIFFPAHRYQPRFENWQPPHGIVSGYVLARVTVGQESREFIRLYELTAYNEGRVQLKIGSTEYTVLVGPNPAEMMLTCSRPFPEIAPTLELQRVDTLPGRDGFLFSINGQPIAYDRNALPKGVNTVEASANRQD